MRFSIKDLVITDENARSFDTYNGVDYEGINERIDTHACLDKYEQYYNGYYYDPVCNGLSLIHI